MSAHSPCINYSDSKILQKIVEVIPGYSLSLLHLKEQVQFQTETKPSRKLSLLQATSRFFWGFFCLPRNERKAAGFRSRLWTPRGINRAIPPKLMSPQRLIGLRIFRLLLIGSSRHKGLYLIGSGPAMGRVKDWDLKQPWCQLPIHILSLNCCWLTASEKKPKSTWLPFKSPSKGPSVSCVCSS